MHWLKHHTHILQYGSQVCLVLYHVCVVFEPMHIGLLLILLPHCCQFPFHVSNQDHHRDYRGDPKVPAWGRKSVQSAESLQAQVMVFSATSSAAPGAAPCVTDPCATHARLQAVPGLHMGLLHSVLPLGSVLGPGASSQCKHSHRLSLRPSHRPST